MTEYQNMLDNVENVLSDTANRIENQTADIVGAHDDYCSRSKCVNIWMNIYIVLFLLTNLWNIYAFIKVFGLDGALYPNKGKAEIFIAYSFCTVCTLSKVCHSVKRAVKAVDGEGIKKQIGAFWCTYIIYWLVFALWFKKYLSPASPIAQNFWSMMIVDVLVNCVIWFWLVYSLVNMIAKMGSLGWAREKIVANWPK